MQQERSWRSARFPSPNHSQGVMRRASQDSTSLAMNASTPQLNSRHRRGGQWRAPVERGLSRGACREGLRRRPDAPTQLCRFVCENSDCRDRVAGETSPHRVASTCIHIACTHSQQCALLCCCAPTIDCQDIPFPVRSKQPNCRFL